MDFSGSWNTGNSSNGVSVGQGPTTMQIRNVEQRGQSPKLEGRRMK